MLLRLAMIDMAGKALLEMNEILEDTTTPKHVRAGLLQFVGKAAGL